MDSTLDDKIVEVHDYLSKSKTHVLARVGVSGGCYANKEGEVFMVRKSGSPLTEPSIRFYDDQGNRYRRVGEEFTNLNRELVEKAIQTIGAYETQKSVYEAQKRKEERESRLRRRGINPSRPRRERRY